MEASSVPVGPPPSDPPPPPPLPPPGPSPSSSYTAEPASSAATKPTETSLRILCPTSKTANIPRDIPGAEIRILDDPAWAASSDERVVLVCSRSAPSETKEETTVDSSSRPITSSSGVPWERPSVHQALVRVIESIAGVADDLGTSPGGNQQGNGERTAVCRLLVGSNQVGFVAGREGRLLEKIRQENPVSVRLVPRDQIPPCASPGDELIEIAGSFSAVKHALLSVSNYLHENPGADPSHSSASTLSVGSHQEDSFPHRGHSSGRYHDDYHKRSYSHGPGRMIGEGEVIFKLLCQQAKVGSLIGKGGSVVRAIEKDTGTYIKIAEAFQDSDERIVVISARENPEQKGSPAQEAFMRVHHRIAEIGYEPGNLVVARLLIPSPQIRYLLGKGGSVINEMRRGTGANIRVSPKDPSQRYGANIDEVVQVMGSLQIVEDALFHITSRIREFMLPMKPHHSGFGGPPPPHRPSPFSDMPPPPHFRPRHNPHSPGPYPPPPPPPIPHGADGPIPPRPMDYQPPFPHPPGPGYGPPPPPFDRPPSPRMWGPQPYGGGNSMVPSSGPHGSGQGPVMPGPSVEVVIPQNLLGHVHGENDCNLIDIRQISGAKVDVYGPKPGTTEGIVVVGGNPDQVRAAQSLIHAFILCGQAY